MINVVESLTFDQIKNYKTLFGSALCSLCKIFLSNEKSVSKRFLILNHSIFELSQIPLDKIIRCQLFCKKGLYVYLRNISVRTRSSLCGNGQIAGWLALMIYHFFFFFSNIISVSCSPLFTNNMVLNNP